ncbi:kinase/pyrophosphorylase [Halanaerobaculum tunisiense]
MVELEKNYNTKIKAIEFTVAADDRLDWAKLDKADIILTGVSCTAKTPLALSLAYQGHKVANFPVVPELDFKLSKLVTYQAKIVGLTIAAYQLKKYRKEKLLNLGLELATEYTTQERIQEELTYFRRIMNELDLPVVDVTDRRVEDLAKQINQLK